MMDSDRQGKGFQYRVRRRFIRFLVFLDVCSPALQQCFSHASQCIFEGASSTGHLLHSTGRIVGEA